MLERGKQEQSCGQPWVPGEGTEVCFDIRVACLWALLSSSQTSLFSCVSSPIASKSCETVLTSPMLPPNAVLESFLNINYIFFTVPLHRLPPTQCQGTKKKFGKQENRKQLDLLLMDAKGETDGMPEDRKPKKSLDSRLCTCSQHRPTARRGPGLGLF